MQKIVVAGTEIVHRHVFELRYVLGNIFWDRCGRVVNEILRDHDDWDFESMQSGTAVVTQRDQNLTFSFSAQKLDLQQSQSPEVETLLSDGEFAVLAESLSTVVVKAIGVEDFPRIGFRSWHLYPTSSKEESTERIQMLKAFRHDEDIMTWLGNAIDISHRIVIERPKHMLTVSISAFEQRVAIPPLLEAAAKSQPRKARKEQDARRLEKLRAQRLIKKYPEHGILVDMDAYIEYPPFPDELSASIFIANAADDFRAVQDRILESS